MPIEDLISKIILKMSSDESVLTPEFIKLDAIGIVNNLTSVNKHYLSTEPVFLSRIRCEK